MAFLDRSSLIVDAVLTDKGREKLSSNSFEVTKFALGDDDVDYTLYDETNTNGPNYYGFAIESMPIMEAFTRSTNALKYQLVTRPVDTNKIPSISNTIPDTFTLVGENDFALISPATLNMTEDDEDYIFTLVGNENDVDFMLEIKNKLLENFTLIKEIDTSCKGRNYYLEFEFNPIQIKKFRNFYYKFLIFTFPNRLLNKLKFFFKK